MDKIGIANIITAKIRNRAPVSFVLSPLTQTLTSLIQILSRVGAACPRPGEGTLAGIMFSIPVSSTKTNDRINAGETGLAKATKTNDDPQAQAVHLVEGFIVTKWLRFVNRLKGACKNRQSRISAYNQHSTEGGREVDLLPPSYAVALAIGERVVHGRSWTWRTRGREGHGAALPAKPAEPAFSRCSSTS